MTGAGQPLDPWDRRPTETDEAWQAFTAYRDQHVPRSLRRLADDLGYKDHTLVGRWSREHDWQERVAGWDLEQDRQRREGMAVENVEAGRRHAQIAAGALQAAATVNLAWLKRLGDKTDDEVQQALATMPFAELSDLMVKVNRTIPRLIVGERLARGMSTEALDHTGGPANPYAERARTMTDDELKAFLLGAASQAAAEGVAEDLHDASAEAPGPAAGDA